MQMKDIVVQKAMGRDALSPDSSVTAVRRPTAGSEKSNRC